MSVRVYWDVPALPVFLFEISRAITEDHPVQSLATVLAVPTPLNFDSARNQYFYDDQQGASTCYYRILAHSEGGAITYDTGFFQQVVFPSFQTVRPVNHDWDVPDRLTYRTPSGQGIPNAKIRVYTKPDYLANKLTNPVAVTETDNDGRWKATTFLPIGMNYIILYEKYAQYGPDKIEISL
jgi:hypothetical protein